MNDELLNTDEVAKILRIAPTTLRDWRYQGRGPLSFKIGNRSFYYQRDVGAWLDAQRAQAVGDATPQAS